MKKHYAAVLPIAFLWVSQALAQVPMPVTNTDFSKETENPVTRQITLLAALRSILPSNFCGGGGSWLPSIVVVALGEPGVTDPSDQKCAAAEQSMPMGT
jgi:hypothetical protein